MIIDFCKWVLKICKKATFSPKYSSSFSLIPLSGSVDSEKKVLKAVNEVLDKCKILDEKSVAVAS